MAAPTTDPASALVTWQNDEDAMALAPGFTDDEIAAMRAAYHSELEDLGADVKAGRQMMKTVEATMNVIFVGASKLDENGAPSTLYAVVTDLPDPEHAGGVIDVRSKEMREEDKKNKVDMDQEQVWEVEAVKAHGKDVDGVIRKVRIAFHPFELLSLGNAQNIKTIVPGGPIYMARISIELGGWHDKDTHIVAIRHKLTTILKQVIVPPEILVDILYRKGACTRRYETKAGHYRIYMDHGLRMPEGLSDREKAAARYRDDNTCIIPLGFEDLMPYQWTQPNSATVFDNTDITTKLKENFTDQRPGEYKPRFLAELIVEQWRGPSRKAATDVMKCMVNVPMYDSLFKGLDWKDLESFQAIFPYVRKSWRMVVIACEDADKTCLAKLTQQRFREVDADDPDCLNRSFPGGLSFAMSVMCRGIIASPAAFLRAAAIPVTAAAVKKLWKGKTVPQPATDVKNNPVDLSKPIICLSELDVDVAPILNDPNRELRVLVPIDSPTTKRYNEIGKMSTAEGDVFLAYVRECVTAKKGAALPKAAFLRKENLTLPADHFVMKHDFTASGPNPLFYVFAINRAHYDAQLRDFTAALATDFATTAPVLTPQGQVPALPAPRPVPALPAPPPPAAAAAAVQDAAPRVEDVTADHQEPAAAAPPGTQGGGQKRARDTEPRSTASGEEVGEPPRKKAKLKVKALASAPPSPAAKKGRAKDASADEEVDKLLGGREDEEEEAPPAPQPRKKGGGGGGRPAPSSRREEQEADD